MPKTICCIGLIFIYYYKNNELVKIKQIADLLTKSKNFPPVFTLCFSSKKDPRRTSKGNFYYPLQEIIFLTISAVISGAESLVSISQFWKVKLSWLRNYFSFENGIPSHDVSGTLFTRLNHKEFSQCFSKWIASISDITDGEVVAVDGKSIGKSNSKTT